MTSSVNTRVNGLKKRLRRKVGKGRKRSNPLTRKSYTWSFRYLSFFGKIISIFQNCLFRTWDAKKRFITLDNDIERLSRRSAVYRWVTRANQIAEIFTRGLALILKPVRPGLARLKCLEKFSTDLYFINWINPINLASARGEVKWISQSKRIKIARRAHKPVSYLIPKRGL